MHSGTVRQRPVTFIPDLAATGTRRNVLRFLAGGAIGGLLVRLRPDDAAAQEPPPSGQQELPDEAIERLVQFVHPQKVFGYLPGFEDDALIAGLYGLDLAAYRAMVDRFDANARQAAQDLLADPAFAARVDSLPFQPGATVVAVGESSTDDLQSWLAILRHLLELRRPQDQIRLVDDGVSGHTTTDALGRFPGIVEQQPDWIVCFLGGNDAARYGSQPTKTLVSFDETTANLAEMRRMAEAQSEAHWVWITVYPVDEQRVADSMAAQQGQFSLRNDDIIPINEFVRSRTEPAVDLRPLFGLPPDPALLSQDGFHPSQAGYSVIARAFVERLTA